LIAASAYPSGGNAQFGSDPSKANRLPGFEQSAAAGCNSATGKPASTENLNNLLADDGDDGKDTQGEQPGLIQQLLNFFFSKLWSPATSDAEKLGWTYVYAEDGSLLAEYGEGSAATSGSAQYLWLPTANGPMPIAAVVNGQTYAVHSDHLNTPRKLTQANGQAVWQWAYSAFGDEQPTTAAKRFTSEMTNPTTGATSIPDVTFNLRYPGQYFDKETGLHYNYFRTYAPGTGRYTQGDPIGLDGGWNRFNYAEGDPLIFTDPLGLFKIPLIDDFYTGKTIACLELEKEQWGKWLREAHSTPMAELSPSQWYVMQNATSEMSRIIVQQGNLMGATVGAEPLKLPRKPIPAKSIAMGLGMTCGCK